MRYDLCFGDKCCGYALAERQGLYFRIECKCHIDDGGRYRVSAGGDRGEVDLGILIPKEKGFGLRASVAMKKLGENLRFWLVQDNPPTPGVFVSVSADEPFAYLSKLKDAKLAHQNGQVGLRIVDQKPDSSSPTGQ